MFSLVISGILWGTGGIAGDLLRESAGLSPLAIAAYRLCVGGLLLLSVFVFRRLPLPRGVAAWRRIVLIGVLAAVFQACFFASISFTSVSVATLITIGAAPVFVLLGSGTFDRRAVGTVCLALTGFVLLSGAPTGTMSVPGIGLALAAAAGFALMTLVSARPVSGLDDLAATGFAFTLGGLLLACFADLRFNPGVGSVSLLLFLGIVPTALAYSLYFRGLRSAPATTAALMALLEPLTGAVLAATLLGDRLTVFGLVGATLLVAAVGLAALNPRRPAVT
ncbi:EamA family transporter [Catelliglobosispora koreensis]|uniref:EamA family transporter n=1 Tax=Catelliglobosispora koreensis TaxID=129052 RepID=UPI00036B9238|nr:EamA family transporter [Catelliglobosispora koreensis]